LGQPGQPRPLMANGNPWQGQQQPLHPSPLVAETVPFISDRDRIIVRDTYLPAQSHKALAINSHRLGLMTDQKDDEAAKAGALEACQIGTEPTNPATRCEIYAVGDKVVYARGEPPMPPQPWLARDPTVERPFSGRDIPLLNDNQRAASERNYPLGRKSKAMALSPRGMIRTYFGQTSPEEAARRALEWCGTISGVPCLLIALDDSFVVPVPQSMRVVGFFHPGNAPFAPPLRDEVAKRLAGEKRGWNAVAAGASGHAGLGLHASSELEAIGGALAECAKQDRNCRVIAIGPFTVEPR
jgi:adenylate cyclase